MTKRETKVVIENVENATREEEIAFIKAASMYEKVLNTDDFWFDVEKAYPFWRHKNFLSFQEFKSLILGGKDKFETSEDFEIRVSVSYYFSLKSVVGYTYPSTYKTWINRNVAKHFDLADIAGNIAHEALHNVGFDHPGTDKGSLVYKFGYLVRDTIKGDYNFTPVYPRSLTVWSRIKNFFRRAF